MHRLLRLKRRYISTEKFIVYELNLTTVPSSPVPVLPVEFRINSGDAIGLLQTSPEEYGMRPREQAEIPAQLEAGEVCFSAWSVDELAFYGWIQFKHRTLARLTKLPLAQGHAFIYRCFTPHKFRGMRIYPAALTFACRWLQSVGFKRVFIDHHCLNYASEKGIRLAGMQPIGEYFVCKRLWLRWARYSRDLHAKIVGPS